MVPPIAVPPDAADESVEAAALAIVTSEESEAIVFITPRMNLLVSELKNTAAVEASELTDDDAICGVTPEMKPLNSFTLSTLLGK
jgi:hypothetical protein